MRFTFPHSHAFPGGMVTVEDDSNAEPECLIEFGDGVTVIANWQQVGPDIVLDVPSYRTVKGTQIEPKSWYLAQQTDGVWRSQRARDRLLSRQKQESANDT